MGFYVTADAAKEAKFGIDVSYSTEGSKIGGKTALPQI